MSLRPELASPGRVRHDGGILEVRLGLVEQAKMPAQSPSAVWSATLTSSAGFVGSCVAWESDPIEKTADEALGTGGDNETTAKDGRIEFLRQVLDARPLSAKRNPSPRGRRVHARGGEIDRR
jgi:hypothetical protein